MSQVRSYIALITVALFGSIRLSNGDLSAESLTTFVTALFLMLAPVVQVTQSFGTFFEAKGALNRVNRLFDLKVEDPCKVTSDSPSTIPLSGSIELDSVSYHSDDRVIIDNVSLSVKEGEKIALTGASGSGKTTIFSLLLNLYDVSSGHIRIGGRDLNHWSKKELRSMVTYVEQEPDLLPGTLRENLTLGSHQLPSDNTLISLLKKFGLEKFSSPAGLERLVGFENSGLSGGERQRVAIIRAIVQQSSIILVDEPTSALDSESAKLAMDSLLNTTATVIFTSHDPEVVDLADKSFVVSDGKLFEDALFNRRMFNE
ncbi:ATP-binding cassette domain-containing protein [Corynebacterium diphtheriae subsp. lausannense]|nr:ATP-binding cassette domain-containing protein [Corynebacterium diphtheriae subsp. lausannense]